VSLTPLGIRVINPQQEKAARADSFLLVPLYKRVFDDYRGNMLPGNNALEAAMEKLGVAPKQKNKARQVFQRSATQAGYFAFGTNRLVAPTSKATGGDAVQTPAVDEGGGKDDSTGGSGKGKGNDGGAPPTRTHSFRVYSTNSRRKIPRGLWISARNGCNSPLAYSRLAIRPLRMKPAN